MGFCILLKIWVKNIGKNLSIKYSQKRLHHAKQSATDALKTASKRAIQKTAGVTGELIGNKVAEKIPKVLRTLPKNSLETVTNEAKILGLIEKYLKKDICL